MMFTLNPCFLHYSSLFKIEQEQNLMLEEYPEIDAIFHVPVTV